MSSRSVNNPMCIHGIKLAHLELSWLFKACLKLSWLIWN